MRRWWALVAAVAVAAGVWVAVARSGPEPRAAADRPAHLLALRPGDVVEIDVRVPATGVTATLVAEGDGLAVRTGAAVPAGDLGRLRRDLAPLLAIRTLPTRRPAYGLVPPSFEVDVRTAAGSHRVLLGATNFDATGVYAAVGPRTALVLPRIAATLRRLTAQA